MPTKPSYKKVPWVSPKPQNQPPTRGGDDFYRQARWRKCRAAYIQAHPLCVQCENEGVIKAAEEVDHNPPRERGVIKESDYEWRYLQGLCKRHHAIKSNSERNNKGGRG